MRATEFITEYRNVKDPAFLKWFGNSKVIDFGGDPLIVYHGTLFNDEIKSFHDLSHFGTQGAANARIKDLLDLDPNARGYGQPAAGKERPHVYPVFLKIENPLKTPDLGDWHISDWVEWLENDYENGILDHIIKLYGGDESKVGDMFMDGYIDSTDIISILKDMGYDGLVYVNQHEDAGNTSWVPFSGKQVMSAFG